MAIMLGVATSAVAPGRLVAISPVAPSQAREVSQSGDGVVPSIGPLGARTTAIVGATVIRGTGAPPMQDATVIISGRRIAAVGHRQMIRVPRDAYVVDGQGLFVLPGFIDANVHIGEYGATYPWSPPFDTTGKGILDKAQQSLRFGVTTLRDSYGVLRPLQAVRDSIKSGVVLGARLLVAGNIVGWGGPNSYTRSLLFSQHDEHEQNTEPLTQGVGEELINLDADSLRVMINKYLDKGVDFIKYGGTVHAGDDTFGGPPNLIVFSDRAQRVIVEEAHKRGLSVETHATSPEGLRMALMAGVDLVQHPEGMAGGYILPSELIQIFKRRGVICSILSARAFAQSRSATRRNAENLIRGGCTIAVATDFYGGAGTLEAIEALVQLGMTPMDAIVAATRNGAKACKMLDQFGTVERGKLADLVVLRADPLRDITNIRQIAMVFKEGRLVDSSSLRAK